MSDKEETAHKEERAIKNIRVSAMEGDEIKVKHEKTNPNSYRVGEAGNRFKIFFNDAEDLREKVEKLRSQGFVINMPEM